MREDPLEFSDQTREVPGKDLSKNVEIDRVLAVNQAIPQSDDLRPFDL